ncbi:hypothetical protein F5B19DRAFT_493078 [Rostrohypoxylon terebratum]|nr:hypothetical protein F5B19DRAFT_493078 [Rostrohypoxylon terebratum]
MYPKEPIKRGGFKALYPQVAKEVNEKFHGIFKETEVADHSGVFYVKERYGIDPYFGAPKLRQVHLAKKVSTRGKKALARAKKAVKNGDKNLVICPHCEGNGFIDLEAAAEEEEMSQHDQDVASEAPSFANFSEYSPSDHGRTSIHDPNSNEILRPAAENLDFVFGPAPLAPMAPMPNAFAGPSQPRQTPQPVAQYPLPNFDPSQMPHNNGSWNGMGNMMDGGVPNGPRFQPPVTHGQLFPMSPTNQPGWQIDNAMNIDTPIHPHLEQMGQQGMMPQTTLPIHMGPASRVTEPFSTGGGRAPSATPKLEPRPRLESRMGGMPGNAGGDTTTYGNPMAGIQTATTAQPGMTTGSQAEFNFGMDNLGGNQDFTIDENFSFQEFLNNNPDFFDV